MSSAISTGPWLALLHQLPAKPPYFRVKIWRRLQAIGAVPLKNAVHVLPRRPDTEHALRDLLQEIVQGGGEAVLIEARMVEGQSDGDLRLLFDGLREAEYEELTQAARSLLDTGPPSDAEIAKIQRRLDDIIQLDFFGARGLQAAEAAVQELERKRHVHPDVSRADETTTPARPTDLARRVWVTRRGIHVDRIACAWLIRRFIDPDARFRFVDGNSHQPQEGELRFDMADAEFTHEGDRCSFETLLCHTGLSNDPGLLAIGEIIHDLDFGDNRYARPETAGVCAMLSGVCASTDDDHQRIIRAGDALDQFYAYFRSEKSGR